MDPCPCMHARALPLTRSTPAPPRAAPRCYKPVPARLLRCAASHSYKPSLQMGFFFTIARLTCSRHTTPHACKYQSAEGEAMTPYTT